jgi:hypothetical protein
MVIRIDWLETYSPRNVHWAHKWLTIPYHYSQLTLQRIVPGVLDYNMVELMQLQTKVQFGTTEEIPVVVQQLLNNYQSVFSTPSTMPLRKACGHTILLIIGASPMHSRLGMLQLSRMRLKSK